MMGLTQIIPCRYIFTILNAIGMAIIYGLKVNLSVAIVAMVNNTANRHFEIHENESKVHRCTAVDDNSTEEAMADGPFLWDEPTQGLILGAYFWGYIVTQFPGGRLSEIYSAKHLFGIGGLLNIVATLLTPVTAKVSYIFFIVMRVLEGLGGGVTFPATHVLLSKWALPVEVPRLSSIVYAGTALGTVISLPLSGYLASELGWESVFYVQGGLSVIWYLLWLGLVYDTPDLHPFISQEEKNLLNREIVSEKKSEKNIKVPWKKIICSGPFWAILITHTCGNWGWYMLLVELPTFMKHILEFNIKSNAILSALPYFCMWLFGILLGSVASWGLKKKYISTTGIRKIATLVATIVPAICLIAVTYTGCDRTTAVVLLVIGVTGIAGMFSGYLTNHIDIAPNYAGKRLKFKLFRIPLVLGTLIALTNTVATIPGFTVPVFVGALTHGNQTVSQWRIIFFCTAALYALGAIVYVIFATGEEQKWNKDDDDLKHNSKENLPLKESW